MLQEIFCRIVSKFAILSAKRQIKPEIYFVESSDTITLPSRIGILIVTIDKCSLKDSFTSGRESDKTKFQKFPEVVNNVPSYCFRFKILITNYCVLTRSQFTTPSFKKQQSMRKWSLFANDKNDNTENIW